MRSDQEMSGKRTTEGHFWGSETSTPGVTGQLTQPSPINLVHDFPNILEWHVVLDTGPQTPFPVAKASISLHLIVSDSPQRLTLDRLFLKNTLLPAFWTPQPSHPVPDADQCFRVLAVRRSPWVDFPMHRWKEVQTQHIRGCPPPWALPKHHTRDSPVQAELKITVV